MKTYHALYKSKLAQETQVLVIKGSRKFTETPQLGYTLQVLFPYDPKHIYTVWESQIREVI